MTTTNGIWGGSGSGCVVPSNVPIVIKNSGTVVADAQKAKIDTALQGKFTELNSAQNELNVVNVSLDKVKQKIEHIMNSPLPALKKQLLCAKLHTKEKVLTEKAKLLDTKVKTIQNSISELHTTKSKIDDVSKEKQFQLNRNNNDPHIAAAFDNHIRVLSEVGLERAAGMSNITEGVELERESRIDNSKLELSTTIHNAHRMQPPQFLQQSFWSSVGLDRFFSSFNLGALFGGIGNLFGMGNQNQAQLWGGLGNLFSMFMYR